MYLPTLRALFSLNTRDSAAAIQALQTASRYDLALGGVGFTARFRGLYPISVRGVAYLAARQPAEAAAEFQRILDHRSIVCCDKGRLRYVHVLKRRPGPALQQPPMGCRVRRCRHASRARRRQTTSAAPPSIRATAPSSLLSKGSAIRSW